MLIIVTATVISLIAIILGTYAYKRNKPLSLFIIYAAFVTFLYGMMYFINNCLLFGLNSTFTWIFILVFAAIAARMLYLSFSTVYIVNRFKD